MRTALSRILTAAVIGATAAGVGTLYAATEPVQGTAHAAPTQVRVWPAGGFDVAREDTSDTACWIELGVDALDGGSENELVCGARGLRPANSRDVTPADIEWENRYGAADSVALGQEVDVAGTTWVATASGFEPASGN